MNTVRRSLCRLGLLFSLVGSGCTCEEGPEVVDAAFDPSIDARIDAPLPDAFELVDIGREDGGPDAEGPAEDPCLTAPRGEACARELVRRVDAARCEGERACGRTISDDGCEAYFPPEGSLLLRASEAQLTLLRLGLLEIVPETAACLEERIRTCSSEDPDTCGPLFRPAVDPSEGTTCHLDVECGPSMYCEGATESAYRPHELCDVGHCAPRAADGEACTFVRVNPRTRPVGNCQTGSVCFEGTCLPVVDGEPAGGGERCNFVPEGTQATYRTCGSGVCFGYMFEELCLPFAELGEACGDGIAYCGVDMTCRAGRCEVGVRFGAPCTFDEGDWCDWNGFGSACIDGICVPNERRLGDTCFPHSAQPCTEGVCATSDEDPTMRCRPPLRNPPGSYCRNNDDDCVGGVCCIHYCVAVGDGPVS